jgi:hypothetical protein
MQQEQTTGAKPRVAYLMGAGASAQRLPVIANMATVMQEHVEWVRAQQMDLPKAERKDLDLDKQLSRYIEGLEWVLAQMGKYVSVDTCARWLSPGSNELVGLKAVLTTFFAIEQHLKGYDPRYEAFVSTMLDFDQDKLHPDMVVLTWNYDQQLPMALSRVRGRQSLRDVMRDHRITSLYGFAQGRMPDFRVLHLNGIAGVFARGGDAPVHDRINVEDPLVASWGSWMYWFQQIIDERFTGSNGGCTFSYAWETMNSKTNMPWQPLEDRLSDIEKLIVIGYSFPDFNRPVDRRLIKSMGALKEIVVQTSPTSMAGILTKLRMVFPEHKDKLVPYELTHEFYVPNELLEG